MSDTRIEDFTLPATGGDFTLSAAARPLVIYFYPKDSTPGCTTESAAFRDLHGEFWRPAPPWSAFRATA